MTLLDLLMLLILVAPGLAYEAWALSKGPHSGLTISEWIHGRLFRTWPTAIAAIGVLLGLTVHFLVPWELPPLRLPW